MSTSAFSVSSLFNNVIPGYQNTRQIQQNFQQLGKDLQSGNLSAAQSDSSSFQSLLPQLNTASAAQSSLLAQTLNQLSQDLKAGNLPAAKQDYSTAQQYFHDAGINCNSTQSGGNGRGAGIMRNLISQLGNAVNPLGLGMISQPQILSIMQQTPQFGPQAAAYTAQNFAETGSSNVSLLA